MNSDLARRWDAIITDYIGQIKRGHIPLAEELGALDLDLRNRDAALPLMPDIAQDDDPIQHSHEVQRIMGASMLWLLGAYEIVRVMDERINPPPQTNCIEIKELKRLFERVRIPLAKLQHPRRQKVNFVEHGDSGYATSERSPNRESGWQMGGQFIARRELADALLALPCPLPARLRKNLEDQ